MVTLWTRTCFLNLLLEFSRTIYPGNLHPIGLPNLTRSTNPNLTRTVYPNFTLAPYPVALPYPILHPIGLLLAQPYRVLPGQITLPDVFPIRLLPIRSYPATLPDRVTLRCTRLLIRPNPITLPSWVPLN
jgi:hypothetical protein